MKLIQARLIVTLLATGVMFVMGCNRSTQFSRVLEGGFDPVTVFRQQGYTVQNETAGAGVRNSPYGYGWQSWCGILTQAEKKADCQAIAVIIHNQLNKTLNGGSLDELTVGAPRTAGQPLTGMLRYNAEGVHGDMHVWLTPGVSNDAVNYVIFVREERLK